MDVGVFHHVTKSAEVFRDDDTPYRFARDEVNSILNMRTRCTGSVRATGNPEPQPYRTPTLNNLSPEVRNLFKLTVGPSYYGATSSLARVFFEATNL